jgi:hypothetical protein
MILGEQKIKENTIEFQHWIREHIQNPTHKCTRVQYNYARWGIQEKIKERIKAL